MAVNVAENDVLSSPVQDDAQVEIHPRRPEPRIPGAGHTVQTQAGTGCVGLEVEGSGLRRPLLVIGQPGQAGGERVGYAELHTVKMLNSGHVESLKAAKRFQE